MACLDTSVIIDLTGRAGQRRMAAARAAILALPPTQRDLTTTILTLAELYEGVERSPDPGLEEARVRDALVHIRVLELDMAAARTFGQSAADRSRRGLRISDMDLLIAATALRHGEVLVTANARDFSRVPGLVVIGY